MQTRLPIPTPPSSASVAAAPAAAPADEAAAKMAAQDAIVSGFDAVAASVVRNARRGEATSSADSAPDRTRNADHSVRAPIPMSTAAPTRPSTISSGPIVSSGAVPATPSPAYSVSINATAN